MTNYRSLTEFYNSAEWKRFRSQLIYERTTACGGILKDEYNGQPIYNSWDIVAHHKQELTLQNVNDISISMNPENIMLVSHRSHNEIHARFGYEAGKKVYLVYGAPCSGKSTFVNGVKGNSDIVVDIDLVWQAITGGQLYHKPKALKINAFGIYSHLIDMIKTRQGYWERAYIITGAARKGERVRLIAETGAEPIFIDVTEDECLRRLHADEKRQDVINDWTGYIKDWFDKYQE